MSDSAYKGFTVLKHSYPCISNHSIENIHNHMLHRECMIRYHLVLCLDTQLDPYLLQSQRYDHLERIIIVSFFLVLSWFYYNIFLQLHWYEGDLKISFFVVWPTKSHVRVYIFIVIAYTSFYFPLASKSYCGSQYLWNERPHSQTQGCTLLPGNWLQHILFTLLSVSFYSIRYSLSNPSYISRMMPVISIVL